MIRRLALAWLASGLVAATAAAAPVQLGPHKDYLFAYPTMLESTHGGDFMRLDYIEARDLDLRDEIPQKRALNQYVKALPKGAEQDLTLDGVRTIAVGRLDGASLAVIFIHGNNGSRKLGADDWMFGGNFNRLKNLVFGAGGLYLSPDFPDFEDKGAAEIARLLREVARRSPAAPIFVACGSMGGRVCWRLAGDPADARLLDGLVLLGAERDDRWLAVARRPGAPRLPILLAHGSADRTFDWRRQKEFFDALKATDPAYPVRFRLFATGAHGTPIRMIDWRAELNWMLALAGR